MFYRTIMFAALLAIISSCGKDDNNDPQTPQPPSEPVEIMDAVLTENLQFPWELLWGPDNHLWMTERNGKITRIDPVNGEKTAVITISDVVSQGEGGLLGMALHPDFENTSQVFVAYCYMKNSEYTEKIVRYNYNGTTLTDPLILIDDIRAAGIHNGSRLAVKNNQLYITTGDASEEATYPQDFNSKNGKVLRVNLDGSIPADNPDPSSPVWSIGHRNPQGLVFVGDSLYSSEHGPDSDDEINLIQRAGNYGWPNVKGVCDADEQAFCAENNVVEPVIRWTPTIAVSGMDYYNSDSIPQWKNSLLVCTLKGSKLVQLKLDGSDLSAADDFIDGKYGRLRDACVSPDGKVYICTNNGNNDKIIVVSKQ